MELKKLSCDFKTKYNYFSISTVKIVVVNYLFSSLSHCYGLYLAEFVKDNQSTFQTSFAVPVVFLSVSSFTNPFSKFVYHKSRKKIRKLSPIIFCFLLVFSIFVFSFLVPIQSLQMLTFGAFSGICSTFFETELILEFGDSSLFDFLCGISSSFGLLTWPHLIAFLINRFGVYQTQLIHSAILLNLIPLILLEIDSKDENIPFLSRYRTVPGLINSQELIDIVSSSRKSSISIESNDSSVSDEGEVDLDFEANNKTETGVHILPLIPEENEEEISELISVAIENKEEHYDNSNSTSENNDNNNKNSNKESNATPFFHLNTYYSSIHFYVFLFTNLVIILGDIIFVTAIPLAKIENCANFLSLTAITAITFMLIQHCLKHKLKDVWFVSGIFAIVVCFLPLTTVNVPTSVLIAICLVFGFTNAASNFYKNDVYMKYVGCSNWYELENILNVLTAISLLTLYLVFYTFDVNLKQLFSMFSCFYTLIFFYWLATVIKKLSY